MPRFEETRVRLPSVFEERGFDSRRILRKRGTAALINAIRHPPQARPRSDVGGLGTGDGDVPRRDRLDGEAQAFNLVGHPEDNALLRVVPRDPRVPMALLRRAPAQAGHGPRDGSTRVDRGAMSGVDPSRPRGAASNPAERDSPLSAFEISPAIVTIAVRRAHGRRTNGRRRTLLRSPRSAPSNSDGFCNRVVVFLALRSGHSSAGTRSGGARCWASTALHGLRSCGLDSLWQ